MLTRQADEQDSCEVCVFLSPRGPFTVVILVVMIYSTPQLICKSSPRDIVSLWSYYHGIFLCVSIPPPPPPPSASHRSTGWQSGYPTSPLPYCHLSVIVLPPLLSGLTYHCLLGSSQEHYSFMFQCKLFF